MNIVKTVAFLFFLLLFSVQAQRDYGTGTFSVAGFPVFPIGIQGSNTDVLSDFGVRLTHDRAFLPTTLGVDVLYLPTLASTRFYVGGGPELILGEANGAFLLGARVTGGLEVRQNNVGVFGEVQPFITPGQTAGVRLRLGLNVYLE